jgi:hypothetical protein
MNTEMQLQLQLPSKKETFLHAYFKRELVYLYFHLFRKEKNNDISILMDRLDNVLRILKKESKNKQNNSTIWVHYLKQYYKLMVHIRDPIYGKGEHYITYAMIYIWYKYYPVLTIYFIHSLVSNDKFNTFGCWRDMKNLCQYVFENSPYEKEDPIIRLCISIMNTQLKKDLNNVSQYIFPISYLAKWIPREDKKIDWLFSELVIDWTMKYSPFLLKNTNNQSYYKSWNKCKMNYRKFCSFLNKIIDTTEIKQCSRKFDEIIPENVSKYTLMKQPGLFLINKDDCHTDRGMIAEIKNINFNESRIKCHEYFRHFFNKKYNQYHSMQSDISNIHVHVSFSIDLPISYFIKEGFELIRLRSLNNIKKDNIELTNNNRFLNNGLEKMYSSMDIDFRIQLLNSQWEHFLNKYSKNIQKINIIPIIDIAHSIQSYDSEAYYTAIGLSLLVCHNSLFGKRILAVDNKPIWIQFDENDNSLYKMIEKFEEMTNGSQSTNFNLLSAIDIIVYSIQQTNLNNISIHDFKIIILSDFSNFNLTELDTDVLYENTTNKNCIYTEIKKRFSIKYIDYKNMDQLPIFFFWNLSKTNLINLPASIQQENCAFLSGFSHTLLKHVFSFHRKIINPYDMISHILFHSRYDVFDTYIDYLMEQF